MLPRTATYRRILNVTLLVLCVGSLHAASLRQQRSPFGEATNETISLPGNFLMMLTLKGGVNQYGANILFNKMAFEKLYACLCHKDTYSCSGNVTYNYGSSYNYNAENIETVQTIAAASMSTKYNCEIPNFGFLANNGGGYFTCIRAESTNSACATDYWSIYIGQCDLEFARVVWDAKHQVSWNYTFSRNTPNISIVSSCICDARGESNCDSKTAVMPNTDSTAAPSDTATRNILTTNALTSTANSTNAQLKEANNDRALIGGTVSAVLVVAALLVVVIIWRYRVKRKKNSGDKDINKLTAGEQLKKDNRNLAPPSPSRGRNNKPDRLFVIPERGLKPDDFPKWNHSRRKEDDETSTSIYCVIGSGVYENDISMNDNTSSNNNNNNSDEKANKQIIDNTVNNKNPFGSSVSSENKAFSLTVTNNAYVPGFSKIGNKDGHIHNSQNNLPKPKQDIKQRQRQPIPTEELIPASQDSNERDSSSYSLGRHFQQNYNFLNRPVEARRIANANKDSGAPIRADNRQANALSSQSVYPLNFDERVSDGSQYFTVDHDFPYDDPSESGGSRTIPAFP